MRKLDEIIREFYIQDLGMTQLDERYPRFLSMGISGIKELNFDLKNVVKEVYLTVNDNDTVDLPSDYLDYLVIGTSNGGVISSLGLNNNIAPRTTDDCGDLEVDLNVTSGDTSSGTFSYNNSNYTKDGQMSGRMYGNGGGGNSNGAYKIYKDEGYISLSSFGGGTIILRYLASAESVDGNFLIDDFFTEFIKAWMMHVYTRSSRSYGLGEKQDYERKMAKARKKSEKRRYRFNIREISSAISSGYRSAPSA